MAKKQKLELTWVGKDNRPKLEPRILIENPDKSYLAKVRHSEEDIFGNMLIKGDNLLALKALEQDFAGKVKCIYIDPPYNTGSAFVHYDDGLEHSLWLSMFRQRLLELYKLLSVEGSLWISLNDNEVHYAKIVADEVFGRRNFVSDSIWQKRYSASNDSKWISECHDHILVYAKSKENWRPNRLPRDPKTNKAYKNPDDDPRGVWRADNYKCNKTADERPNLYYPIINPNTDEEIWPKKTAVWRYNKETHERHIEDKRIWWGMSGSNSTPAFKRFLSETDKGAVPQSVWTWQEVGHNQDAKREQQALHPDNPFSTPKPERLIERILTLATNKGDLVLDSFAGSGTTGAVAHKMGRRWIMVELGEHCDTHAIPRMHQVIDGDDQGGISKTVNWKGGGGFRYYALAPSLLEKDKYDNWVISRDYNPAMLTEALCKHMGFAYAPSEEADEYWNHGYSTETDFIYVTTQSLTHDACKRIADDVGPDRSLLICCKAFSADPDKFENLTLVKIPTVILAKCEWGKDDYSLNIKNLPLAEVVSEDTVEQETTDDLPLFNAEGQINE